MASPDEQMISILLLHGSGWDEFLMIGGAILIAFLVVKFTSRGGDDEPGDAGTDTAAT